MSNYTKRVIEKIRKCFALSKSVNANEAAVALKQAYALARKYNLDNQIEELSQITSGKNLFTCNQKSLPLYLDKLLGLINYIFQTRSVTTCKYITYTRVVNTVKFFGNESDIMIAEYAWAVLSKILIKSRSNFLKKSTDGRMKKITKTRMADIYALGWIHSVQEEIKNLGRDISEKDRAAHSEKIRAYQNLIFDNTLVHTKTKRDSLSKQPTISEKEYNAYKNGIADGKTVSIDKGVAGMAPKLGFTAYPGEIGNENYQNCLKYTGNITLFQ